MSDHFFDCACIIFVFQVAMERWETATYPANLSNLVHCKTCQKNRPFDTSDEIFHRVGSDPRCTEMWFAGQRRAKDFRSSQQPEVRYLIYFFGCRSRNRYREIVRGLNSIVPAFEFHPLSLIKILVMHEEMDNLARSITGSPSSGRACGIKP